KSIRTTLLPVDVEQFLAQVKDTPTEKDLQDLFDKHRKDEPNPRLDRPGFMTPKHIKLEYIAGKVDSPNFRKLGQENAAKDCVQTVAVSQAIPAFSVVLPPASWVAGLGVSKFDDISEARIQREYEKYKKSEAFRDWIFGGLIFFNVHDTSVVRPEIYAAAV